MTSLSEVYSGETGALANRRQRRFGMALFVAGAAMVGGAIALATTGLSTWFGLDIIGARRVAGILAGLGLPAAILGVFAVLPTSDPTRATALIGTSIAVFGVLLFSYAYPSNWLANNLPFALATTAIYTLGALVLVWCLFVAVATFKTRNDPGGSARVRITDEGTIRVVDTGRSVPGLGGIGLLGSDPNGDVPTQTGRADDNAASGVSSDDVVTLESPDSDLQGPEPTSDGGRAAVDDPATDEIVTAAAAERGRPDKYCGNCDHFEYVRADGELEPYCTRHSELMEDMNACEQWEPNS
jgi:cytochrome c biogenesis protein CcdA